MKRQLGFVLLFVVSTLPFPFHQITNSQSIQAPQPALTGVYRIDIPASDRLYSVVAGASSNVPFREQQKFFIDLAVRFSPPDLLAIEQHGNQIAMGSSRAPRMTFVADGVTRVAHSREGKPIRVRLALENGRLAFTSRGKGEDNFEVVFEPLEQGRRLQVVRRIVANGLDQPLVIRSVYNRISTVARWELYAEAEPAGTVVAAPTRTTAEADDTSDPGRLRAALRDWIAATNGRDIEKQMSFYAPQLKAYYLTRNTPQEFVRDEKARVFATATVIDIRAEEPELIFADQGRTAVMRYRKKYRIENGRRSRRGEVIQELRWRHDGSDWKIFLERDIRVLR